MLRVSQMNGQARYRPYRVDSACASPACTAERIMNGVSRPQPAVSANTVCVQIGEDVIYLA